TAHVSRWHEPLRDAKVGRQWRSHRCGGTRSELSAIGRWVQYHPPLHLRPLQQVDPAEQLEAHRQEGLAAKRGPSISKDYQPAPPPPPPPPPEKPPPDEPPDDDELCDE